jgi:hypothetical protein
MILIRVSTEKQTAENSIRRSRLRLQPGRKPASSIGGSKSVSSGSVGYAVPMAGNGGSELWIFDPPKTVRRAEEVDRCYGASARQKSSSSARSGPLRTSGNPVSLSKTL